MILTSLDIPLAVNSFINSQTKVSLTPVTPDSYHVSLMLQHTVVQLNELVCHRHFVNRQEAVVAAVNRLDADEETQSLTTCQEAFIRLCGALHLGTARESLWPA